MSAEGVAGRPAESLSPAAPRVLAGLGRLALTTVAPIVLAVALSGIVLATLGVDVLTYFAYVLQRGLLTPLGFEQTLTRMAPLLLLAASLIVAFRAGIWNLGIDGSRSSPPSAPPPPHRCWSACFPRRRHSPSVFSSPR